jgi:enterochelin esterase-like enzyme
MTARERYQSLRIAGLQRQLDSGDCTALDEFWHAVRAHGTPLIEPLAGDAHHLLVTFLWRDTEQLKNVVVVGGLAGYEFAHNQMTRLPRTDLWYRTYRARADTRTVYWLAPDDSLVPAPDVTDWAARSASWRADPCNPRTVVWPKDEEASNDNDLVWSVLELPLAPPQPWSSAHPDTPAGQVTVHRLASSILKNERRVWVYTPPAYSPSGQAVELLVLFDGLAYIHLVPTPTILDNLLAAGRLPPMLAVIVDTLDQATRTHELACFDPFVEFLAHELVPWVRQHYNVANVPEQTVVGGSSYGGLAAAYAGLRHPNIFGNILSQSGSFMWKPGPDHEDDWLPRQFVASPTLPLRFYLDVGLLEVAPMPYDNVVANRHMRNILQAKGYAVHYAEFSGGHDYVCWRGTLANGLVALRGKR